MKTQLHPTLKGLSRSFFLFLFLTIGSAAFSQNGTISTTFLSLPDTANLGDSATTVLVVVKNIDSVPYSGYINIYYSTDTVAFTPVQFCSLNNIALNAGDTVVASCTMDFAPAYFNTGDNIVVVWSSGNGKFAADTLRDSVYLNPQGTGIHESDLSASFSIFPSPAKELIGITVHKSGLQKDLIQQIKIVDVFGRTVHAEAFQNAEGQKINVSHLTPGVYFLELLYSNRQRAVQKFVRGD